VGKLKRKDRDALIKKHYEELIGRYRNSSLKLERDKRGNWIVHGILRIKALDEDIGYLAKDSFKIKMSIPEEYPEHPPLVFETGNRIPKDYSHVLNNGALCLDTPLEVWLTFSENPCLLHYVKTQVIQNLYAFCYWETHEKKMPWGERSHERGIFDNYKERFDTSNPVVMLRLLKYLVKLKIGKEIKGHFTCPCGSRKKMRKCHGEQLRSICEVPKKILRGDCYRILNELTEEEFKMVISDIKLLYFVKELVDEADVYKK